MKNSILILFSIILAVTKVAAQDAISPILGQEYNYSVEEHTGSSYHWEVMTATLPYVDADASAFVVVGPSDQNQINIKWNTAGLYLLVVTETDFTGCTNKKALAVQVSTSNSFVQFQATEGSVCYGDLAAGVSLPLSFYNQENGALDASRYPITLNYTINGVSQTAQAITYADQQLDIDPTLLFGDGSSDQVYTIEITGATDAQNTVIQRQTGSDSYQLTVLIQPQISFLKAALSLQKGDIRSFSVTSSSEFILNWHLIYPDGTDETLASTGELTDNIQFLLEGVYELRVRAKAANGCYSEWQTMSITVNSTSSTVFDLTLAVSDVSMGWKNQAVDGNVLTNDIFGAGIKVLTVISQPDGSTGKLTKFDTTTGEYTFVPAVGYTGEASFEYRLCETLGDGTERCSESHVTIQILNTDVEAASPVAVDKYFAVASNGSITDNFVEGDFSLNGETLDISSVNTPSLEGGFTNTNSGDFSYSPLADFGGSESFNYKLCGSSGCDWSTVTLYIWNENFKAPDLLAGDVLFYNTGILKAVLPANRRLDGAQDYTCSLVEGPLHGTVTINEDGTFEYKPNPGETDYFTDQFQYKISNSDGEAKATVYISSYIESPQIIVQNQFTTGACLPVELDASKSTGVEPLSFSWTPTDFLNDVNSPNPVFTPGESTDYTLTLTDALGNTNTRIVSILADPMPDVVTSNLVFVNNSSESIMLDASESTGAGLSYNWESSGSGVIVSGQNTATPEVKGTGRYYLTVTDRNGCMDRDSVVVGIWIQAVDDQAEALVNNYVAINVLRNDIPQGGIDPTSVSIVVPPSNGLVEVQADSMIVYTPDQDYIGEDEFIYQVCDYSKRCDEATVLVMVSAEALFIPNAFTPNGDGYNDRFEIKGLAKYDHVEIKIFNRWGNLVYGSEDYGVNGFWDGVANRGARIGKGQVASGVYFYSLNLGKGEKQLSGFIYIDR